MRPKHPIRFQIVDQIIRVIISGLDGGVISVGDTETIAKASQRTKLARATSSCLNFSVVGFRRQATFGVSKRRTNACCGSPF